MQREEEITPQGQGVCGTQVIILYRNCKGNVMTESTQVLTRSSTNYLPSMIHFTTDPRAKAINHSASVAGVQEVLFCLAAGFHCYAVMGENMIRGTKGRRCGGKMED